MEKQGVSIVVPTSRNTPQTAESLRSICHSLELFQGRKELILSVDRVFSQEDPIWKIAREWPFIRLLWNPASALGAPITRLHALRSARYEVILFTDDDCLVPENWVSRLYQQVGKFGIVTGGVRSANPASYFSRFEELIDLYRVKARDSGGSRKFISFPNFGIRRKLLPPVPFDSSRSFAADDMDLGCRLRLNGDFIFGDESMMVETYYPVTFQEVIRRKLRHARGIAWIHQSLGESAWRRMEIGSHRGIIKRWVRISLSAPLSMKDRLVFLVINMSYCLGLMFYDWLFRNQPHVPRSDFMRSSHMKVEQDRKITDQIKTAAL